MAAERLITALLEAINARSFASLSDIFVDPILVDGGTKTRSLADHIAMIQAPLSIIPDATMRLETLVPDTRSADTHAAVRILWHGTLSQPYAGVEPTGQPFETWEHSFVRTTADSSRIAEITAILDTDVFREQKPSLPRLIPAATEGDGALGEAELRALYEAYIACINAQTTDAAHLSRFCQPTVTHNGQDLDLASYGRLMLDAQDAIEGLVFTIGELVVDEPGQRIACRIDFKGGVPVKEFGGLKPCGKAIEFTEQVIYYLEGGKIRTVLSVVDLETARQQLAA